MAIRRAGDQLILEVQSLAKTMTNQIRLMPSKKKRGKLVGVIV